jgi:hypothetical protein
MKISIIVPTRSRSKYLSACLSTCAQAARLADVEVEIVVSDNASDDDTPAVAKSFSGAPITYFRQPQRVSMRQNFEAALDKSSGTHVIFIGDDDAVLPNGLRQLSQVIKTTGADCVNWYWRPNYLWPNSQTGRAGEIKLRFAGLSGGLRKKDPQKLLHAARMGRLRSYLSAAKIYHGCVSRDLIERARAASQGVYFWGIAPDIMPALHNLYHANGPVIYVDHPITLAGQSPRSNGASMRSFTGVKSSDSQLETAKFVSEAQDDAHNGRISTENMSVELMTLDALQMCERFNASSTKLDLERWAARVRRELRHIPVGIKNVIDRDAEHLLGFKLQAKMATEPQLEPSVPMAVQQVETSDGDHMVKKIGLVYARLSGGKRLQDVAAAARFLDEICDGETLAPPMTGLWSRIRRIGNIRARIRNSQD